jgi:multidrug efflux system membrane fusion protein
MKSPFSRKAIVLALAATALVASVFYVRHLTTPADDGHGGFGGPGRPGGMGGRGGFGGGKGMPQTVKAEAAIKGDVPVLLSGLGTVTATNTATVRSRVDGLLQRIAFTEGQVVKAGQLLAELDPRPFQVALNQAQGTLSSNLASLANAKADLERYRQLAEQDSVATQKVDAQVALVRQLEGTVKAGQAAVDAARLQLEFSRISAPISGRTGLRQVDIGNQIHTADANGIVVITQVQPINVIFSLPEAQLGKVMAAIQHGANPQVEAWDRDMRERLAVGRLLTVDNQIDVSTGTVKLKAEFANTDGRLFPNQFVNALLQVETLKDATLAPVAAVQLGKQGSYVWVVGADRKTSVRQVKTGSRDGERLVISDGLKPGELVVTDGVDRLSEGGVVKLVDPADAAGAGKRGDGKSPTGKHGKGKWNKGGDKVAQ